MTTEEANAMSTPLPPPDCFREIGFDTAMWFDRTEETVFFIASDRKTRLAAVSPEAVAEFVDYWSNQIAVARDYLANGRNPRTHEWAKAGGDPDTR